MSLTRPRALVSLLTVLALVMAMFAITAPARAADNVDLTAALVVPPTAPPASDFTSVRATIGSNGLDAPAGGSFSLQFDVGTANVSATCETTTGDAPCPTNIVVTPGTATVGPIVTGDLGAMPHASAVTILVAGRFPSASSARAVLTVSTPAGVDDADPKSNVVSQSTALPGGATIAITKTQDEASVAIGGVRTYTVTLRNTGDAGIIGLHAWDAYTGPSATITSTVECATETTAACPTWADHTTSTATSSYVYLFNGYVDLPAHTELVLTVTVVTSGITCLPNAVAQVSNTVTRGDGVGIPLDGPREAVAAGTLTGDACPSTTLVMTKVQDKDVVALGEARTYTVTVRNTGAADIPALRFWDSYIPGGTMDYSWSVNCVDTDTSIDCPTWADGETNTLTNANEGYLFRADAVTLPAGSELVLRIPVTATVACLQGGSANVRNYVNRADVPGMEVTGGFEAIVQGTLTGPTCPPVNLEFTKTQDKAAVALGAERHYTLTMRNTSDTATGNVRVWDEFTPPRGTVATVTLACVPTPTSMSCPSWVSANSPKTIPDTGYLVFSDAVNIPAHEELVIDATIVVTAPTCFAGGSVGVTNWMRRLTTAETTLQGPWEARADGTVTCVDISTTTTFSDARPAPRAPLTVTAAVSNAQGTATDVDVLLSLPRGGFIVDAATTFDCTATDGGMCPTDLRYDAAAHALRGTIPSLPAGASVLLSAAGTAGVVPPRTASYLATSAATADGQGDPSPASNISDDSIGFANSQTTVTVVQRLGAAASVDLTFTGVVTCALQGDFPVSLTIPAGQTEASAIATSALWANDDCSVTMTAPTAPTGYSWGPWDPSDTQSQERIVSPATFTFTRALLYTPVEIPVGTPAVNDPCGPANAAYLVPLGDPQRTWVLNADGSLTVTAKDGFVFDDGTMTHTFDKPLDSGKACDETPDPGGSQSPSPGGSESPSPGGSESPDPSGSPSVTPDPSGSPSVTPDPSGSPSVTPDPSGSPSVTPDPSGSPSVTPDPSGSPSVTPDPSGSPSVTPDPSATPGTSGSPSPSSTPSDGSIPPGSASSPPASAGGGLPATGAGDVTGLVGAAAVMLLLGLVFLARRRTSVR